MSEGRFRVFFRIKRESFNALAAILREDSVFHNSSRNPQASVEVPLATALYFLDCGGASVVRGAAQVGISEGTIQLI